LWQAAKFIDEMKVVDSCLLGARKTAVGLAFRSAWGIRNFQIKVWNRNPIPGPLQTLLCHLFLRLLFKQLIARRYLLSCSTAAKYGLRLPESDVWALMVNCKLVELDIVGDFR
jgi:hypothetical protein